MTSVLIIDDSVVVRRLVTDALAADPSITVVGTAANGRIGLAKIESLRPDVVTLDIEMPVLDGLATLREIRKTRPHLPVIMFSTLTELGAAATLDALSAGASDYVTKPANVGSVMESIEAVRSQLLPRIHALAGSGGPRPALAGRPARPTLPPAKRPGAPATVPRRPPLPAPGATAAHIEVIAVGCSTGGPAALHEVLRQLPASLPVPVVIVQHMPPMFTLLLSERLDRSSPVHVVEARNGTPLNPGTVYIAPGDFHLEVNSGAGGKVVTHLTQAPPENWCRPAVDVLFRSVARVYGPAALGVVLTGMGHDGRAGAEALRATGARILAQNEATSVVWGMPGAVVEADLADVVLPLDQIGHRLVASVTDGRQARREPVTR